MMREKPNTKDIPRPLRSGTKLNNMKLPGQPPEKIPKLSTPVEDLSILKKSVDTSVSSPVDIMKTIQGGTPEIMDTLKNECSMIYECKVCRNLFRSIANFITHKRSYCKTKFASTQLNANSEGLEHLLLVGTDRGSITTTRKTARRDILSLLDNFQERVADMNQSLVFSEIPQSSAAVYNTTNSTTTSFKDETVNNNNCTPVVGPNGRVVGSTQDGGNTTRCKSCGETVKDIEAHLTTCNSVLKQCFRCPLCGRGFTTAWAAYRHLRKVHGQSTEQVRKLRSLIIKQELPVEQKLKRQSVVMPAAQTTDKGWMEELEKDGADGMYKCYICAKQFDRRVALISHTQTCEKRKSSTPVSDKKMPSTSTDNSLPPLQVKMYFDKTESVTGRLTDCRVVATRLESLGSIATQTDTDIGKSRSGVIQNGDNASSSVSREEDSIQDEVNVSTVNVDVASQTLEAQVDCRNETQDYDDRERTQTSETLVNGFLSSPTRSSKGPDSPEEPASPEEPCNGWSSPVLQKPDFYSPFMHMMETENDMRSGGSSRSVPEETMGDIDNVAITRIICGSIKSKLQERSSEDGDAEDSHTVASEKQTSSVSTEVSYDLEQEDPRLSDSDQEETDILPLEPYISKTRGVCYICGEKLPSTTREGYNHVADHLGLYRFACTLPACPTRTFLRSHLVNHIKNHHNLDSSSTLIRVLNMDEMLAEGDDLTDFRGFHLPLSDLSHSYKDFFSAVKSKGILPDSS